MTDMRAEVFLDGRVTLHCGDCLDVLKTLDADSFDSCVTDPPYHLTSEVATKRSAFPGRYAGTKGASVGFMGKTWDGGDIAFRPDVWREVFRVLKPGAHLLSFGSTRTYHRMACAVEDAGFEIRDCVQWIYGQGFAKSHNLNRQPICECDNGEPLSKRGCGACPRCGKLKKEFEGYGTALKPAVELIVLARKPLSESTVAANVLKWGTGALNIDGCRVGTTKNVPASPSHTNGSVLSGSVDGSLRHESGTEGGHNPNIGRWPANVIHDGSEEVVGAFPETAPSIDAVRINKAITQFGFGDGKPNGRLSTGHSDSGSAARFYYSAKADGDDRLGSKHPTVKPLDLMQYLVRLVTPPGGLVLDCFAGTGTTGEAAWREGMRAVLIEREAEYQEDIRRRMLLVLGSARERRHESVKARTKDKPVDHGPLFAASPP